MKRVTSIATMLLLAGAAATASAGGMGAGELGWRDNAATPGTAKTRAEVRAELEQARHDGTLIDAGDAGLALNQAYPARYPAPVAYTAKSRNDVKAELAQAKRNGDVIVGDSSVTLREEFPARYPAQRVPTGPSLASASVPGQR